MSEELTPEQRAEKLQSVVVATVEFDTGHKLSTSQSELVAEQATKHIQAAVDAERDRCAKVCEEQEREYRAVARQVGLSAHGQQSCSDAAKGCEDCAAAIRKGEPT